MKKWLMAVLFGTMFVLGACGGGSDNGNDNGGAVDDGANNNNNAAEENNGENETADSGDGEEVYQQNCASCHGDDLSGNVGPALDTIGSELSVDEIKDIIENGQGSMPAGIVSGDDEDDVAEWLASHE